jgi:hypothetical protein
MNLLDSMPCGVLLSKREEPSIHDYPVFADEAPEDFDEWAEKLPEEVRLPEDEEFNSLLNFERPSEGPTWVVTWLDDYGGRGYVDVAEERDVVRALLLAKNRLANLGGQVDGFMEASSPKLPRTACIRWDTLLSFFEVSSRISSRVPGFDSKRTTPPTTTKHTNRSSVSVHWNFTLHWGETALAASRSCWRVLTPKPFLRWILGVVLVPNEIRWPF